METYGPKDKEALSLLRNTQAQLEDSRSGIWCAVRRRGKSLISEGSTSVIRSFLRKNPTMWDG